MGGLETGRVSSSVMQASSSTAAICMMMLHRTGSLRALKISVGGCDVASMVMVPGQKEGIRPSCCQRRITFTTIVGHAVMALIKVLDEGAELADVAALVDRVAERLVPGDHRIAAVPRRGRFGVQPEHVAGALGD